MTPRIKKIFFGLLSLAILSFVWISGYFKDFLPNNLSANILSKEIPETPLTKDSDKDGLTDRNEILYGTDPFIKDTDGDGFIDGEEVATGSDPRTKDEGAVTGIYGTEENGTPNLTNRFVNQTVANLIGDNGQIDPEQFNNKTFAAIIRNTLNDSALSSYQKPISNSEIAISQIDNKESVKKYLESMMPILEESQIGLNTVIKQINSVTASPFDGYAFFQERYEDLRSIPVPKSWLEIHRQILTLHLKMSDISQFLNIDKINEDPLKAMVMINLFQDLTLDAQNIFSTIATRIKKENLKIDNSLVNLLLESLK